MSYYIYEVDPDNYNSDEEFFNMMNGEEYEQELSADTEEERVKEIFDELRLTPFRNSNERVRMIALLSQLLDLDTPETRRLFKAIGTAFNDLADDGLLDGSYQGELEEASNKFMTMPIRQLGYAILEYHGGMGTATYKLGSSLSGGKLDFLMDSDIVDDAISEIRKDMKSYANSREAKMIIDAIQSRSEELQEKA